MALTSPEKRLWWKEPLHRMEIVWISIAFLWGLFMFFMMIYWHVVGDQNLSNEAYRVHKEDFVKRTEAMVEKHKVREVGDTGVRRTRCENAAGDADHAADHAVFPDGDAR